MQTQDGRPTTFELGRPSAPLPISQIAIVVRDIDDALEKYSRFLGWGPWSVYEHKPPSLHDTFLHGEPTNYTMTGAETRVGAIVVELLQPGEGPSIYKEWLADHGEGLHHIAVMRPSAEESDEARRHFEQLGAGVLMEGRLGKTIHFLYLDTEPLLKVIFETGTGHAVDLEPVRTYPGQ
jgi:methylmalonyl-CoA/ethylmalonyl-CoA epimerase